ncbi:putative bifunctional diguanylate cyclase/phosphodiesterase [Bacillus sp. CGMCC 1.16607]|uniref:putative bifunctional diguanylate cyclase/phosphodiesterase n=1 Tax=Bacillus sp. CGMCC 1.16607 TaxID=3351842 RepID=UPI003627159E
MLTIKRPATLFVIIYTMVFYVWLFIFKENDMLRILGTSVLSFLAGSISFIWMLQTKRKIDNKPRKFWLLLNIGIIFYLIGHIILFYSQIINKVSLYSTWGYFMWLVAYFFFLLALIYQTKVISSAVPKGPFQFNIFIFMIIAATISIHFLIKPIWEATNQSFGITFMKLTYPILDLSILFVLISLYYLSRYTKKRGMTLFISLGFGLQILTDTMYAYLSYIEEYQIGSFIDPLWPIALLIIGFGSFCEKENINEQSEGKNSEYSGRADIFPYIGVVFLLLLAIHSYYRVLNTLSFGVIITMLIVIFHQLAILKKNKNLMSEYKYLAYHDPLTGLENRTKFVEDLNRTLARAKSSHLTMALILIDLDRFKNVNDTLGHHIGDKLLIEAAERLKYSFDHSERVYRIGGDEFIIILSGMTKQNCIAVSESLVKAFTKPFLGNDYVVTPSIGVSLFPENGRDAETLLKNADTAMYLAKERGKNNYQFFDSKLDELKVRRMQIESGLRRAIEHHEFTLFYQPKVELQTGKMTGMEALLRWEHPQLGPISPGEFIPIAEETGQIVAIGEWVLRSACLQNKKWQDKGFSAICVSVNVSVLQFQHSHFIKIVRNVLEESRLHPKYLELEITESIMQDIQESTSILNDLRTLGVRTSLDDFGTGYSSLHILKKLPIDTIKIDKSFIDDILDPANQSMVKAIINIGLNLKLNVVAEGIEHEHQMNVLKENKCSMGQGYFFAKPVNTNEFEKFFSDGMIIRV